MRLRLDHRAGVVLATAAAALVAPASAAAFYGNGAQLISADYGRLEQGDDTTDYAVISDDARYVVFQTRARNFFRDDDPDPPGQYREGGIFRFDLQTRALEPVADGSFFDERDPNTPVLRGALNPSVSADGRFVAFSTAQQLVLADTNESVDVYVRDMTVPIRSLGAFDLVSARDGSDVPARYAPTSQPRPGLDPGSDVTRGEGISADGRTVAFRTTAPSDLAGGDTPARQVFVRQRISDATTLVTRDQVSGEPAGGASGPVALSGDGTAVAWTGGNAAAQTPFLDGENQNSSLTYYLWRRVADGPDAPTRRVTGATDPDDPACPDGEIVRDDASAAGPCYGPLAQQEGIEANIASETPAMSHDGWRVVFLTAAAPRGVTGGGTALDLYSTVMSPGVSRKAGTLELTRDAPRAGTEASSPIRSPAIAPDGRFIAITTSRTRFPLAALRVIGATRAVARSSELYVIDLGARTIERAVRSVGGGDASGDVEDGISLSAGAGRIAFTSAAGNLFVGDGNSRSDAFVVDRQSEVTERPPLPPVVEDLDGVAVDEGGSGGPVIRVVRRRSLPDGRVVLTIRVPGAGELKSQARARRPGSRSRRQRSRRSRTLATSTTRPRSASPTRVVLRVVRRYRRELRRKRRLVARAEISYVAASGGRRLRTSTRIEFRVKPRASERPNKRSGKRQRARRGAAQ